MIARIKGPLNRFRKSIPVFTEFLIAAIVILVALAVILSFVDLPANWKVTKMGIFSLAVDMTVGIFTIWGLIWAGTQFAQRQIKPDLDVIIGKPVETPRGGGIYPIRKTQKDKLIGEYEINFGESEPKLTVGLFLENSSTKAARFVRITLTLHSDPLPIQFEPADLQYDLTANKLGGHTLFLQGGPELIVYKGPGVYVGNVLATWKPGTEPDRITLIVGLYNLEGEPKENIPRIRHISWEKVRAGADKSM